jgi:hypothetical protein
MNLRNVLRTYGLLRQLTDDETALLNTLRAMNDNERELLVQSLQPEKKAVKKTSKKPSTTSGNSRRGLPEPHCAHVDDSGTCGHLKTSVVHDTNSGYIGHHPFVAPTTAPRARNQSSVDAATKAQAEEAGFVAATTASGG